MMRGRFANDSPAQAAAVCVVAPVLAVVLLLVSAADSAAQTTGFPGQNASADSRVIDPSRSVLRLPVATTGGAAASGVTCDIRFSRQSATGYVGVQIDVQSITNFAADRNWVIQIEGLDPLVAPPNRNLMVDVPITIQQGAASQTFVRYIPRWAITHGVRVEVLEDGRLIPGFESDFSFPINVNGIRVGGTGRGTFVNSNDLRYLAVALGNEMRLDSMLVTEAFRRSPGEDSVADALSVAGENTVLSVPLTQLPTDWRGYQSLDLIVVRESLLEKFEDAPATLDAIRHWILLGGIMVVIDSDVREVDSDPSIKISATMNDLGISNRIDTGLQSRMGEIAMERHSIWSSQNFAMQSLIRSARSRLSSKSYAVPMLDNSMDLPVQYDWNPNQTDQENLKRLTENVARLSQVLKRTHREWNRRIWVRHAGAGLVFGVPADVSTGDVAAFDFEVIESMIDYLVSPMLRRGVDPMIGDTRFRDWLIPGVAQPPVYTFIGLLTVFVILVGPVAYRWTTRHHRSHLMFLIAPVLAMVTTALMFAYGILSDGFGTSARIRQLTIVDAASNTGVERIRSTYFAGVRPSDGLTFGGSDEVMAYPETQRVGWIDQLDQNPQTIGRVVVGDDVQRFDSSFLPSRRQTQFVVHRPRPNIGSLSFQVAPESDTSAVRGEPIGSPPAMVRSGFDFPLRRLIMRTGDQQYWTVDSVGPQETAAASSLDAGDASKKLGGLYNDFRPLMKASTESRIQGNSSGPFDLLREVARTVSPQLTNYDGVIENDLRFSLQSRLEIPIGSFIAISEVSDDVVAIEGIEKVDSVRYVMGTLANQDSP